MDEGDVKKMCRLPTSAALPVLQLLTDDQVTNIKTRHLAALLCIMDDHVTKTNTDKTE